ncbi:MAG: UbiA family prenyltransferase [Actinomycetota bacterium]|nr:UbiA family prenyltransferase [Actinomycetota bacterium]
MRAGDLAELVRLPAALTVPGDAWSGAAHLPVGGRGWLMPVSSVLLYWSGMALNDWSDREVDTVERPERPIPSGRVEASTALGVAAGLGAAGVAASALVGGRSALRISLPLAALVATYDVVAKDSSAGPLVMASTRGLDVLLGAHTSPRLALHPAAAMATHTAGVTALSRGEVHGGSPAVAGSVLATTCVVAATGALAAVLDRTAPRRDRLGAVALAAAYAGTVGRAQARTIADPSAATVRRATGTGIGGFSLLQASWLTRRGRWGAASVLLASGPLLRAAARRTSTT